MLCFARYECVFSSCQYTMYVRNSILISVFVHTSTVRFAVAFAVTVTVVVCCFFFFGFWKPLLCMKHQSKQPSHNENISIRHTGRGREENQHTVISHHIKILMCGYFTVVDLYAQAKKRKKKKFPPIFFAFANRMDD